MPQTLHREWTQERAKLAAELWSYGFSTTEIARRLGGVTRAAVIGKLHRMRAPRRANPTLSKPPVRKRPKQKRRIPRQRVIIMTAPPEPVASLRIPLCDLSATQCHWVTDDTRFEQRYCGHVCAPESPYCPAHKALAYQSRGRSA